jgi:hypothetical protein
MLPPMMRGALGLGQCQRAQLRRTRCVNTRDRHDGIEDNHIQWQLMHFVTSSRLVVVQETNSAQHAIAVTHSKPVSPAGAAQYSPIGIDFRWTSWPGKTLGGPGTENPED